MGIISGNSDRRRSYRSELQLRASYREYGTTARMQVRVLDLSVTGFRMETNALLEVGQSIHLEMPGLESKQATIAWGRHGQFGCSFSTPLHPAVVDHIARTAPTPTAMTVTHQRAYYR